MFGLIDVYTWEMLPMILKTKGDADLYQRAMFPRCIMIVKMEIEKDETQVLSDQGV